MLNAFVSEEFEIVEVLSPANPGYEGRYSPGGPTKAQYLQTGCVFLHSLEKTCEVHAIKPIEGRIACCRRLQDASEREAAKQIHEGVALSWASPAGEAIVSAWKQCYLRETARSPEEIKHEIALGVAEVVVSSFEAA